MIPTVAKYWIDAYEAVPKLGIRGLSFSFSILSAVFLTSVRFLAEHILVRYFGWPEGEVPTQEAAANCTSITHSTFLCIGLLTAFASHAYSPSQHMSKAPKWWQTLANALLEFCTGYMIYDAVVNILWLRWQPGQYLPELGEDDILFLGHHIITSSYMLSARILQAGHMSAMMCMLLGELTNPLHNSYMMSEVALTLDCCNGPVGQSMNKWISVSFAAMYNVFRVVLGPLACCHMTYDLLATKQGRTNIPLAVNIIWNLMIWAVIFGSVSWIVKCHGILMDFAAESGLVTTSAGEL